MKKNIYFFNIAAAFILTAAMMTGCKPQIASEQSTHKENLPPSSYTKVKFTELENHLKSIASNDIYYIEVTGLTNTDLESSSWGTPSPLGKILKDCGKKVALKLKGDTITVIGESTFSGCTELTGIIIPEGITKIEWGAFSECTGLTEVKLPASLNEIEGNPFSDCVNLTRLTVNDGNSKYKSESNVVYDNTEKEALFAAPGITGSITIPDDITAIGGGAFSSCTGLTNVSIPESVTAIGERAFSGCTGLTSVTIPKSLTSIAELTFNDCSALTQVEFPENAALTEIEKGAFDGCINLTTITIPNKVTTITESAFPNCTNAEITLPESITTIGGSAFGWDTSSYCKKVRIKSGTHYDRIKELVKVSGCPEDRIESY